MLYTLCRRDLALHALHGTPARRLQGCDARSSVAVWHFAIVPSRRLPSCRRCSWAAAAFRASWTCVVTRTYSTFGDRALFCSCWTWTMEQSSIASEREDFSYNRFRRPLDIFVWIVQWSHGAVWTILIAPFRNNFYLVHQTMRRSGLYILANREYIWQRTSQSEERDKQKHGRARVDWQFACGVTVTLTLCVCHRRTWFSSMSTEATSWTRKRATWSDHSEQAPSSLKV